MKLFFRFEISQKVFLPVVLVSTLFMVSCASNKQHHAGAKEEKVDKVITAARSFLGTPYKYGGTTRSGMDCSGLLLNSFRAVEVSLPRSSEAQSKVGEEIDMKELEPGDLIFFATGKRKREITHVGLVTERKGKNNIKFIHSSTQKGVIISSTKEAYYGRNFAQANRILM